MLHVSHGALLFGLLESTDQIWNEERGDQTDDGYDDHELDEREACRRATPRMTKSESTPEPGQYCHSDPLSEAGQKPRKQTRRSKSSATKPLQARPKPLRCTRANFLSDPIEIKGPVATKTVTRLTELNHDGPVDEGLQAVLP